MRIKDLFASNQIYAIIAKGLEGTKIIAINVMVARFFGPEDFGRFAFILGISSIIAIVAEFRIQSILVKEISTSKSERKTALLLGSAILANTFFSIAGIAICAIYSLFEQDEKISEAILIYSLAFIYKIPRAFRAYFITHEKNIIIAKAETAASIISISSIAALSIYSADILWIVFARSIDFAIISTILVYLYISRKPKKIKIFFSTNIAKKLSAQSAPLVLSGAAMILFQRIDLIIIKLVLGEAAVGVYSSATNAMLIFSLAPMVISESLAPKMFRGIEKGELKTTAQRFTDIITIVGVIMSLAMLASAAWVIPFLYGETFSSAVNSTYILSACPIAIALGASSGQLIVSNNTQNKSFLKSIIACIATLSMNILLIPLFGIEGAAISTVAGLVIANYAAHMIIPEYKWIFSTQNKSITNIFKIKRRAKEK